MSRAEGREQAEKPDLDTCKLLSVFSAEEEDVLGLDVPFLLGDGKRETRLGVYVTVGDKRGVRESSSTILTMYSVTAASTASTVAAKGRLTSPNPYIISGTTAAVSEQEGGAENSQQSILSSCKECLFFVAVLFIGGMLSKMTTAFSRRK